VLDSYVTAANIPETKPLMRTIDRCGPQSQCGPHPPGAEVVGVRGISVRLRVRKKYAVLEPELFADRRPDAPQFLIEVSADAYRRIAAA
jgi:hypothetical protein